MSFSFLFKVILKFYWLFEKILLPINTDFLWIFIRKSKQLRTENSSQFSKRRKRLSAQQKISEDLSTDRDFASSVITDRLLVA